MSMPMETSIIDDDDDDNDDSQLSQDNSRFCFYTGRQKEPD